MRVGLFDSGIGGLTVLKELIKYHPNHHYIYFGDNLNMPYGNKSKEEICCLSSNIIEFLIDKEVDLIVIACGTISSNVNEHFKEKYNVPIIDIISPTIDYINKNNYTDLGLIATSMTVKSKVFSKKIKKVREQMCPSFVPLIESNEIDTDICNQKINEYLLPLKNENIKTLVLGCTHYPLLVNKIKEYFNNDVELINMGTVLANSINLTNETDYKVELYFSKANNQLIKNAKNIIGENKINLKVIGGEKDA